MLDAPLDVIVVRKLGVPFQPELAMGAISEGGVCVVNSDVVAQAGIDETGMAQVKAQAQVELERRAALYRERFPRIDMRGRIAVVIDDGVATGSTVWAACEVARAHGAVRVVLAVPVAPKELCVVERPPIQPTPSGTPTPASAPSDTSTLLPRLISSSSSASTPAPAQVLSVQGKSGALSSVADEVICLDTPRGVFAVGQRYEDFSQVTDADVTDLLARFKER
jgi:predicted phosphoribosyltransferase